VSTWPVLPTLAGYERSWLTPDVLAGLTLVAVAVPEQMATAHLAGMPTVDGLYAFVAGSFVFALIGRDRHMSVGADSTIAPVIASGVGALALFGTPHYVHLVSLLALMVGVFVLAAGALRLGWVAEMLSTPVITGVLAGIAVQIVVRQLPAILGLPGGGSTTIGRIRVVLHELSHTNGWSVAIAAGVFALILVAERIDRRIPGALIGLLASTLLVAGADLVARGVAVVGRIHSGLPTGAVYSASWQEVRHLAVPAFTIAFLIVVQTAATLREAGTTAPAPGEFNLDLVGLGAANLVSGVSGSFAVNASPPRTSIVAASGGRSQLTSLVAGGAVLVLLLVATGALKDIPEATLGAILVYVATRLFRFHTLGRILAFSRLEFTIAIVTMLAVALIGIEQGVVLAVVLSLADRIRRAARPTATVLGREVGTDHWIPVDIGRPTAQVPGVLVYLVYGAIWYGNADYLRVHIPELLREAQPPVHGLVLDADAASDIDFTGSEALAALVRTLSAQGVRTVLARSSRMVHHDLQHSGLVPIFGQDGLFASVDEAVRTLTSTA
jgi:sulfate permease, SulP family